MKYTLWYSCYIDLIKQQGVAATFIEHDGYIRRSYSYCYNATINRLDLIALVNGLKTIPPGSDVDVLGNSKYISEVLKRIPKWVERDEIDVKSHSDVLIKLWGLLIAMGKMGTQYWTSRRSHPMLWSISKASAHSYRTCQERIAKTGRNPPDMDTWEYDNAVKAEDFLLLEWKAPLTDAAFEKLIAKENMKQEQVGDLAKIIPLRQR